MNVETEYANTDFDLKSVTPFDTLQRELDAGCCVLHYTKGEDGHWHAVVESSHGACASTRNAELDIREIISTLSSLSELAKTELETCYLREFNIGVHCWDTWSYLHRVPAGVVKSIADVGCSLAVTLYPMRNPDGTPREER